MSKDKGVTIIDGAVTQLFAGDFPRVELPVVVVAGSGVLAAGTLLGKLTAGNYGEYDTDGNDGSEKAVCILADDIDATSEDVNTTAYFSGHFNEAALTLLDDAARVDFAGTPIFIGKLS